MLEPCWHIFRSWALVKRIFRVLLRLLSLSAGFLAFWTALEAILERSRVHFGGFWRLQEPIFQGFCAHACLRCPNALNATKPQFHWVETHFARNALDAKSDNKSLAEPRAKSVVPNSGPWDAQRYYWSALGLHLGVFGALLARFWALLGPKTRVLGRS